MGDHTGDAEFGRAFVARAVTVARIEAALAALASKRLGFGPFSAGPAGLARISAQGTLGAAQVRAQDGTAEPSFAVTVPATLDFEVRLGAESTLRADVQIDLCLTARTADPLLLVIDVAPVQPSDVRIALHGTGIAQSVSALLGSLTDEIAKHVAKQVNATVNSDNVRSSRTIDVTARIDGRAAGSAPPLSWQLIEAAEFARRFLAHAVTRERLADGFAGLAGQEITIGPLQSGPRDLATVTAIGAVGTPRVAGADGQFTAVVPVHLDLVVDVARANHYDVDVEIPLTVTPRLGEPLAILVDIAEVDADDVRVEIAARGAVAGLLGKVGHLREQVQEKVAARVNERLADAGGRTVDVGARIDNA